MRIAFYYYFPEVPSIGGAEDFAHMVATSKLYERCRESYPEIEFSKYNACLLDEFGNEGPKSSAGCSVKNSWAMTTIQNLDNGKHFMIYYWDRLFETMWEMDTRVETFAAMGVHDYPGKMYLDRYTNLPYKLEYTPISPIILSVSAEEEIERIYQNEKVVLDKPFFRGHPYGLRSTLKSDERFDIEFDRIVPPNFVNELGKSLINIDFPAAGEVSSRSIEAMGLQTCLIRPRMMIQFHDPLIPNYHYASIDYEDYSELTYQQDKFADKYIEKYEYYKNNIEEAIFIAKNARDWYVRNATTEAHVNILFKLLDFNKLA